MADVKISALPAATTPLAGTEVLPIVQSSTTKKVAISDVTAGRAISASSLTLTTTPLAVGSGGTGLNTLTAGYIPFGAGTSAFGYDSNLFWNNTNKRLGIGTTSPSQPLVVSNSGAAGIEISPTATGSSPTIVCYNRSSLAYVQLTTHALLHDWTVSGTPAMRLDASGNLGIGTTNTASAYANYTLLTINGSSGSQIKLNAGDAEKATFVADVNALYITSLNKIVFSTATTGAASPNMLLDTSGNLLVGTTSSATKFCLFGPTTASFGLAYLASSTASDLSNPMMMIQKYDNDSTTSQIYLRFSMNNGSTAQGQINANGASAVAFGSFSDQRLKRNIVDLPSQLDNILSLRPREFDYIESEGGGHQIGFIAQEMQQVYPDTVGERADGMLTITAWSKTEARLVRAIQELAAKVQALEAKVQ